MNVAVFEVNIGLLQRERQTKLNILMDKLSYILQNFGLKLCQFVPMAKTLTSHGNLHICTID